MSLATVSEVRAYRAILAFEAIGVPAVAIDAGFGMLIIPNLWQRQAAVA